MLGLIGINLAQHARDEATWRAQLEGIRSEIMAAPVMRAGENCPKCGDMMLPKYAPPLKKFGTTLPEHIRMTCACGFEQKRRPLDASV